MASIDLGTLKASVAVEGAEKAKNDLRGVNDAIKGTEKASDSLGKGGMSSLTKSFKDGISNSSIFGMKLGDLGKALSSGAGASGLMQGAVAGLAMALVNLAVQAIQQAIAALWNFAKQSVKVASDLEESANVIEVVFGKDNKVKAWSEENAKAFNLSALEAQKFAGTMGAVLTPTNLGKGTIQDMSITLTKLSGDLGSLWNTSTEEAFNALRSAITGEMEPMKRFGVVMSQANLEAYMLAEGINKQWKELTQAEQAIVRYNYLLENTKTAQGDAARTADGYANASKQMEIAFSDASNSLGQGLLPGLTSMKQQVAEFLTTNKAMFEMIGQVVGTVITAVVECGRVLFEITKPVWELLNLIAKGISEVFKFFNTGTAEAMTDIRNSYKQTGEGVTYEMQNMAQATDTAMIGAAESVSGAFGTMEESAKGSIDRIDSAYKSFFDKQMSDYEKKLREQYDGGTLREEKIIQKKLALHEDMLNKQLKKDEEYAKKRAEMEARYGNMVLKDYGTNKQWVPANRNANGTSNFTGGLSVVGEVGRELMYIPPRSQIMSNNTTEQIFKNMADNTGVESRLDALLNATGQLIREIKQQPYAQQELLRMGVARG